MRGTWAAVGSVPRPRMAMRAVELLASPPAQLGIAIGAYLVGALVLTWPMAEHTGSTIFGQGFDAFASIAETRELVQHRLVPFLPATLHDFSAPEGLAIPYPLYVATWASTLPKYLLVALFGPVAGYDLFIVAGYLLTGVAMFLLARKLSGSAMAALVAGWAFAFSPLAVAKGQGHAEYVHGWVFVLLVWRLLELRERPSVRNGVYAGLASVVAISFNPYFVLLAFVIQATLAVADLALARRERLLRPHLIAQAVAAALPLIATQIYLLVNVTASATSFRSNPISDPYRFGARLLDYLVPPPTGALLGGATRGFWRTHLHGSNLTESTVYLGWTVLVLAALALLLARTKRLEPGRARAVWLLGALGATAFVFSFPPSFRLGGLRVYTPTWIVFHITSTWRVFERFGLVVMLVAALLAAVGLGGTARRLGPRAGAALLAAGILLVPLDLWAKPDPATFSIPHPWVYTVLAAERPGIVAEYPLALKTVPYYDYALYQNQHGHPMLNGYAERTPAESRALWLSRLDDPQTSARLSLLGVRYVVLDGAPYPAGVEPPGRPTHGFRELAAADNRVLLRVTGRPSDSLIWPARGFSLPEGPPGSQFAWMVSDTGELDLIGRCSRCRGRLTFTAWSFARPRRVVISIGGRVVFARTVGTKARRYEVPITVPRSSVLRIEVSPGSELAGTTDPRSLSVAFLEPTFVPA